MKLLNLSNRENKLFYIGLTVIALLLAQAVVIEPLATKWRQLDTKIAADKIKLEKINALIRGKDSITSDYENSVSAVKMAGSTEEEMAKFLTEIESIANSSSVHINEIKPLPAKKFELYRKFYADIELEGEMAQISDLMRQIQDSAHLLAIDRLSLSSTQVAGVSFLKCRVVISKIAVF